MIYKQTASVLQKHIQKFQVILSTKMESQRSEYAACNILRFKVASIETNGTMAQRKYGSAKPTIYTSNYIQTSACGF